MVIFKQLELKNFKSYKNTKINFNNGITIIVGENGAGKSTIFEAISFALFKKHASSKIDYLVRTSSEDERMSVTLHFDVNGEEFQVTRSKTKSSSSAELRKVHSPDHRQIITTGDSNVNKEIESLLGLDTDLFINAIYIRQGEIAELVNKKPAERKKLIGKLLKLDDLEKAWENTLPLINEYDKKAAELKGRIADENELTYNLNRKKEEQETIQKNIIYFNERIEELQTKHKETEEYKEKLEKAKQEYEENQTKLNAEEEIFENITIERRNLQNELDEIQRNKTEMKRLEKYAKKLQIYKEFKEISHKLETLDTERKHMIEKASKLDEINNTIKEEKPYADSYAKVETKINKLEDKKRQLETELNTYKQLEIERINYEQEIKNNNAEIQNFYNEIQEIVTPLTDEFKKDLPLKKIKDLILKLEGIVTQEIESREEEIKNKNNQIAVLKSKITDAKKSIKDLETIGDQCPVCQSPLTEDKKEELNNTSNQTITQAQEKIEEIKSIIERTNLETNAYKIKLKELNSINNRFYNYQMIHKKIKDNTLKINDLTAKLLLRKDKEEDFVKISRTLKAEEKNHEELKPHFEKYQITVGKLSDYGSESEIKEKLFSLENKKKHLQDQRQEYSSKDILLSENISNEELDEKIKDLASKSKRYDQLQGQVLAENNVKTRFDEKTNEMKMKNEAIKKIEETLKTIRFDERKYKQITDTYQRLTEDLNKVILKESQLKGQITELNKSINDYQEKIERNKEIKNDLINLNDYMEFLNTIRDAFSREGVQKDIREKSRPSIQANTKKFFEKFNFNYSDLLISEDFSVKIYGPEGESNLDMVSGGEKIAIAIALRLGITQSMGQGSIDAILLDEPTIHLDSYRRQELVDIIRSMNLIPQMIIVTHDSELESAADNVINIVKENGISKVKT